MFDDELFVFDDDDVFTLDEEPFAFDEDDIFVFDDELFVFDDDDAFMLDEDDVLVDDFLDEELFVFDEDDFTLEEDSSCKTKEVSSCSLTSASSAFSLQALKTAIRNTTNKKGRMLVIDLCKHDLFIYNLKSKIVFKKTFQRPRENEF